MPEYKGVTIKVTTQEGVELDEYGVKSMARRDFCSAYIPSETDVSFKISLMPDISFFEEGRYQSPRSRYFKRITRPSCYCHQDRSPSSLEDEYMDESDEWDSENVSPKSANQGSKSPTRRASTFHLLATVYIDGRTKYEHRVIIYLDPKHRNFAEPDGKVWLTTRWSKDDDGTIMTHKWIFKDVGIETMFDQLMLSGNVNEETNKEDEDTIIDAMNSLGTKVEDGDEEEAKVGVITITLQRIKAGYEYLNTNFNPSYRENEDADVDMVDANQVTHTTGLGRGYSLGRDGIPVITFTSFEEPPYATFKFFYRSKDVLRKFGFANFPQSPLQSSTTVARGCRQEILRYMTPLSISHPLSSLGMPRPPLGITDQRLSENQSPKKKTVNDKSNGNVANSSKGLMKPSFRTFRDTKTIDTPKGKGKDKITAPPGIAASFIISDQHNPRTKTPTTDLSFPSDSEEGSANLPSGTTSSSSVAKSFIRSFKGTSKSPARDHSNKVNENEATTRAISASLTKHVSHDLVSTSPVDTLPALTNKPYKFTAIRHPSGSERAGSDADDEADSLEVESKDALTSLYFTFTNTSTGISQNRDDHGLHEQLQDVTIAQPGMKRKSSGSTDDDDELDDVATGAGPACLYTGNVLKNKKLCGASVQSSTLSGYLAGSDSSPGHASDNTTPTPPSLLLLLPGIAVTAPSGDEAEESRGGE